MEKKMEFDRKRFINTLLVVGLPVALQNLISSSLNLVDTMMIGKLGESEIAAVGMANQLFFLFMLVVFGVNSGASVLISQFWGKNDRSSIRKTLGIGLTIGVTASLIFVFVATVLPKEFLGLLIKDNHVIELGARYLRIVGFSYLFTAVSASIGITSRSVEQAKLPMVISFISLSINTILNYGLIFGNFGLPKMGVEGAAIATLIARIIEMTLLLIFISKKDHVLSGKFVEFFSFDKKFFQKTMEIATPVVINEFFWALGTVFYAAAIGRIGTNAVASYQIALNVYNFMVVAYMGIASSCTVMVGKEIGAGHEHIAIIVANKFVKLAIGLSLIMAVVVFNVAPLIVNFFDVAEVVRANAIRILKVYAVFGPFKVFTLMMIVGVLRGGGDTKFSMFLEICSVWIVGVPMSFLGAIILKLPVYYVVPMILMEEVVKSIVGFVRFRSKKWVNNVIKELN